MRRSSVVAPCSAVTSILPCPARRDLEEPDDLALGVDVDVLATGSRRKAGHRPHLAREGRDESRSRGQANLADGEAEARRAALERGVVAERVLALGHADRQLPEPEGLVLRQLL